MGSLRFFRFGDGAEAARVSAEWLAGANFCQGYGVGGRRWLGFGGLELVGRWKEGEKERIGGPEIGCRRVAC